MYIHGDNTFIEGFLWRFDFKSYETHNSTIFQRRQTCACCTLEGEVRLREY